MTVQELISKLELYPAGMRVVLSHYNDGYYAPNRLRKLEIEVDINKDKWYLGDHKEVHTHLMGQPIGEEAVTIE